MNFFQDIETFDLEDFKYNNVNITAFRLVDVESRHYIDIMEQMKKFQYSGKNILDGSTAIQVDNHLKRIFLTKFPHSQIYYVI